MEIIKRKSFHKIFAKNDNMGIEESKILQLHKEQTIFLPNKNITVIPDVFPPTSAVQTLNLSSNRIKNLPPKLKFLSNLNISSNELFPIPPQIYSSIVSYTALESLDLSRNGLQDIGNILNEIPSLRRINLFGNKLTSISFDKSRIETADLGNNLLTKCPVCPDSIVSLNIDRNKIKEFVFDLPYSKLAKICASGNQIETFSSNSVVQNLYTMDLSHNMLKELPDMITFFPRLHQIDVSDNFLNMFPMLQKGIVEVYLQRNKIITIPNFITTYATLIILNVSHNNIKAIEGMLPNSLVTLYIYDNELTQLSSPMNSLSRVFMMENKLSEIPNFQGNSVTEYYLSRNCIKKLSFSTLSKNISRLDLSGNQISRIPDDVYSIQTLTHLFLPHNKIKKISDNISQSHIILLDLSDNPIRQFPKEFPQTLEMLYLSFCNISSVPNQIADLPDLVELDISNNSIQTIPLIPSLHKFISSMNKMLEMPEFGANIEYIDVSMNQIAKIPETLSVRRLKFFDISNNKITTLPKTLVFPCLRTLKVHQNPLTSSLNPHNYPTIEYIDCSSTSIFFDEMLDDNINLISSEPGLFNSIHQNVVNACGKVAYSIVRGLKEPHEDSLIIRNGFAGEISLYGLFDGRGGHLTSYYAAHKTVKLFGKKDKIFSEEIIKDVIDVLSDSCFKKHYPLIPDFGLAMTSNTDLIIYLSGRVKAYIVGGESKEILSASTVQCPRNDPISLTRTFGPMITSKDDGDSLVFGVRKQANGYKSRIHRSDKWLILLSVGIADVLSAEEIIELGKSCKNASELASTIKGLAYANMCSDNMSVIVIDLSLTRKRA